MPQVLSQDEERQLNVLYRMLCLNATDDVDQVGYVSSWLHVAYQEKDLDRLAVYSKVTPLTDQLIISSGILVNYLRARNVEDIASTVSNRHVRALADIYEVLNYGPPKLHGDVDMDSLAELLLEDVSYGEPMLTLIRDRDISDASQLRGILAEYLLYPAALAEGAL